jgi:uncharacterized protein YraI
MTMRLSLIAAAGGLVLLPHVAEAAWGTATGSVNMRTCASIQCPRITVVPRGAQVWIGGSQGGWLYVTFAGRAGYVSGTYIGTAYAQAAPPPRYYSATPYWDPRYGAWYDGRRWYFNGRWYDRPSGFSFGFGFGG